MTKQRAMRSGLLVCVLAVAIAILAGCVSDDGPGALPPNDAGGLPSLDGSLPHFDAAVPVTDAGVAHDSAPDVASPADSGPVDATVPPVDTGAPDAGVDSSFDGAPPVDSAAPDAGDAAVPLAPVVVTTTPGNGQVTLTWNAVQGADSYDVYYGTTPALTGGTKVPGAVSGVAVTGLTNGQLYYFGVTTVAAGVESALSNQVSATPAAALSASIASVRGGAAVLHSGVVVGRASGAGLTAVQISVDGAAYVAATGTATWSFALPRGAATWHEGSKHTIAVRSTDGAAFSPVSTVTVRKGANHDVNGDGYADVVASAPSTGAVYVFASSGAPGVAGASTGAATVTLTGPPGVGFGQVLALGDVNGDGYADVVVGSGINCNNGATAVYVFQSAGAPLASAAYTAATTTLSGLAASCFGSSVAVGDVDGDGYGDVVVGAQGYTLPTGHAFVFRSTGAAGVPSGADTTAMTTLTGATLPCNPACVLDQFGAQVAVGDVNGDGYGDVAVSALQNSGGSYDIGAVYVFPSAGAAGVASGTYSTAQSTLDGPPPVISGGDVAAHFGQSMTMGDVNSDGYADVVVGAPFAGSKNPTYWNYQVGAVYAFASAGASGIASGNTNTAAVTLTGALSSFCCTGERFGNTVAVGDVNGDGYADIVATATQGVKAYVFASKGAVLASGDTTTATTTLGGGSGFGYSAAVGDPNGDGFADVIVGELNSGTAYVFGSAGSPAMASGTSKLASAALTGSAYDFGYAVAP